jgi:hypothetical protein
MLLYNPTFFLIILVLLRIETKKRKTTTNFFFSIVDKLRIVAAYDEEILMTFSQGTIGVSSLCENFNPVSFASTSAGL